MPTNSLQAADRRHARCTDDATPPERAVLRHGEPRRHGDPRRRSPARLLLAVACALSAAPAGAQGNAAGAGAAAPPPASAAAASASASIPLSEVVAQAESASSTLKEVAANGSPDPATTVVARDLPALTQEIDARLEETAQTIEGSMSLENLKGFEGDWRTLTVGLPQWRDQLNARTRKLEGDLARLDELGDRWRRTLEQLRAAEGPPEMRARVEAILQAAAEARRSLTSERSRAVALENRVAEQQARVDEALKTIAARRGALVGQLLVQDSPPMWRAELWARRDARQDVRGSLAAQTDGLGAFVARNRDRLLAHAFVFALLASALHFLRRGVAPIVQADPRLEQPATIFRLPVSTALVLAILLYPRIYPHTPQLLGALFGAVVLVPTVVILRRLFAPALYPLLYSLVVFFFVDKLRAVTESAPSLERPLFLVQMLGGILFFLWFRRTHPGPPAPDDLQRGRVYRVVRAGSLAVLPLFAVAALGNLLGYVNVARLVGGGALRSLYAAVVLYAIFRIVDALFVFALRLRPLNRLNMARLHATGIRDAVRKLASFGAFGLWVVSVLEFFSLRQVVFREARDVLTAELRVGSLALSAGDVLLFFLVVWLAFQASRFIRFALEEDVFPRLPLARGVPYAISTIVNYVVLLLGFFFALSAAGLDLTRVTVLVGAFGVGIGFGLQNIFNNFISGLILLFERPIEVGDEIRIGDASGTVRRIGIRASRIRQWDNSEIIVPNSRLISENVKNWTFSARKRGIEVSVSIDPGADSSRAVTLLTTTAKTHPLVADEPAPQVLLGDLAAPPILNFKLRVWTARAEKATEIASDLALAISKALADERLRAGAEAAGPEPAPDAP